MEREEPATITYRLRREGRSAALAGDGRARRARRGGRARARLGHARRQSERKEAELELSHPALHDALTGLPNRALFLDRLARALAPHASAAPARSPSCSSTSTASRWSTTRSATTPATACCVDVAERLARALRPADTVARFGGDEFTVLCEDVAGESRRRASPSGSSDAFERARSSSTAARSSVDAPASASRIAPRTDDRADGPAARRRRRDVPRQGARQGAATRSSTRRCAPSGRAARDRERAAPRARARRARVHYQPIVELRDRARSSASRRWCAGSTRRAACSARRRSSRSPRRPG